MAPQGETEGIYYTAKSKIYVLLATHLCANHKAAFTME